jgi:hypothetical protein
MVHIMDEDLKRRLWTSGYLNGAVDYVGHPNSHLCINELIGWMADSAYDEWLKDQAEKDANDRVPHDGNV